MTNSNQQDAPAGTPEGTIPVDPDEGFGPHIVDSFLERYGEESVFVTATVDCLTYRFIQVLARAGKLPEEHHTPQYGAPAMREALEQLLSVLGSRGMDKPAIVLMRAAIGHEGPSSFLEAASMVLGTALVEDWLFKLEREDYVGAGSLLVVH